MPFKRWATASKWFKRCLRLWPEVWPKVACIWDHHFTSFSNWKANKPYTTDIYWPHPYGQQQSETTAPLAGLPHFTWNGMPSPNLNVSPRWVLLGPQSMKISKFGSNFREKCMDFPNSSTLRIIWFDFGRVFHSPWSNTEVLEVPHQSSRFFQWFSKKSAIHLLAIPHVFPRPSRFYWSEGSRKSLGVPDAVDWCMAGGEGSTNRKNGWWRSCNDDTVVLWCHLNCPKFMAVGTISTFMYLNICI